MALPPLAVSLDAPGALAGLIVIVVLLLVIDFELFAPDREPTFREGLLWSIGWLALSLAVALPLWAIDDSEAAVNYVTVYLIERSLSLDNLFVFIVLFAYFAIPVEHRARLLFFGIVGALLLRGLAILGGVALIRQFEPVLYVLGVLLIVLAFRLLRGVEEVDPDRNLFVRTIRRVYPVTSGFRGRRWFVSEEDRRHVTPLFLCMGAIMFADVTFAIDSIPAAFGITRDSAVIWMGNAFALMGLRALFVLVEGLIARIRFLDETIAVVLALVGLKLITEDLVHLSAPVSLGIVLGAFAVGTAASLLVDRRQAARERADYSRPTS